MHDQMTHEPTCSWSGKKGPSGCPLTNPYCNAVLAGSVR